MNIRRNARIQFILDNWDKYRFGNYPWGLDTMSREYGQRHYDIVKEMKGVGVIASSTYWKDVPLNNLIVDARKHRKA